MNFNNTFPVSSWTHSTNKFSLDNSSDLANGHLPKNQLQLTQTGLDWINTARKYRAKKLFWAKFERTPAFPDLSALHATPNVTGTLMVTFNSICQFVLNETKTQAKIKSPVELEAFSCFFFIYLFFIFRLPLSVYTNTPWTSPAKYRYRFFLC